MLNADAVGYYRSVHEPAAAKRWFIANTIRTLAKPTVAEKMMIAADLVAMGQREELAIDQLLALAPIVAADKDDRVAQWALSLGSFPTTMLDAPTQEKARRWQVKTFGRLAKRLGWTRGRADSQERHELRIALLARVAEFDRALAKQAVTLADKWLATRSGVDDELVPVVLAVAAHQGDRAWFDKVIEAAKAARDRDERSRILGSLGGLRDPELLSAALDLMAGGDFDLLESRAIFFAAIYDDANRQATLQFVIDRMADILPRLRDDEAGWILAAAAERICDPEMLAKASAVLGPLAKKYMGAEPPVLRGLEMSRACVEHAQRAKPALEKFLASY
jgi:hypothetical protein